MSLSFEIFPTKKKIPNCDEVIKCSVQLFSEFLEKENISREKYKMHFDYYPH